MAEKKRTWALPPAMFERLEKLNNRLIEAQNRMAEDVELARKLSGAPPDAILRDLAVGFEEVGNGVSGQ